MPPRAGLDPAEASLLSNHACWTDSIVLGRAVPKMEIYTEHPPSLRHIMLSYPDRSVFRAKLAQKGDPQMMDEKYKKVSADFLGRAQEKYGLHRGPCEPSCASC